MYLVLIMLSQRNYKAVRNILRGSVLLVLLLWNTVARTQDAVGILRAKAVASTGIETELADGTAQPFSFERNLIYFPALLNGKPANFILDTGAPTLLINHRGDDSGIPADQGMGASGAINLTNQRVNSFAVGGKELGKHWALALDLRPMEARTGKRIDGFIGHQQLRGGEVRIDFPGRSFQLLKSERKPLHEGQSPKQVIKFTYIDHLPVITLRVGKRKLRFAVDTGAGVNLLHEDHRELTETTGELLSLQGLGGKAETHNVVRISTTDSDQLLKSQPEFTLLNMDHLQTVGKPSISGILGSVFFCNHVVGIDYRRQRLYLW